MSTGETGTGNWSGADGGWDEAGAQALLTRSRYQSGARVRAELPSVTATFCVRFLLFVICKS